VKAALAVNQQILATEIAMAGALGGLLIFFSSLIAVVIFGLLTLSYAAHGYLAIVEDTGAGSDDVRWPDESFTDFIWKPFYLAWVVAGPVVVSWFGVMAIVPQLLDGPLGMFVAVAAALWLLFPIFMLSSLSGRSGILVLHFALLARLIRHPGVLLLFYLLSGPVLAAGLALVYFGLFGSVLILPVAVPACVSLFFIHARLLGRLAWCISQGAAPKKATSKKRRKRVKTKTSDPWAVPDEELEVFEEDENAQAVADPSTHITARDPRTLPSPHALKAGPPPAPVEEEEDEWAPRKKPYALAADEASIPRSEQLAERVIAAEDVIAAAAPHVADADALPKTDTLFPPDPRFLKPPEPPPRFTLFSNVWSFPVNGSSLRPFVQLIFMGTILVIFLRLMLMTRPT